MFILFQNGLEDVDHKCTHSSLNILQDHRHFCLMFVALYFSSTTDGCRQFIPSTRRNRIKQVMVSYSSESGERE